MHYFIFNNINSNELGIIVKNMPLIPLAEKDIESIKISGKNGNLHIDNGTYNSINYTIDCVISDISKIDNIKKAFNGTSKLILSKYNDRYFEATIKNQISFDKYLNVLQEFPLQFELQPISYSNELEEIRISSDINNLDIGGNTITNPIILVDGTGTFTINNVSVEILESGITIDCELMNCTKNNLNANDKVILDKFPTLNPTDNVIAIESGINNIELKYRKRWL